LTAATFRPAPGDRGERLYYTGDLGRRLPDGTLLHLGRKDSQVKIRGYRIEVGEIEAVLSSLPNVSEAVVVPREDEPGEPRLVAYVVTRGPEVPGPERLRDDLASRLPEYMLPSSIVPLRALPLTPNGKVDRRSLPRPTPTRPSLAVAYIAPRSPLETRLAAIWAEVLQLDRVGVFDEFVLLGGDSLRATRVAVRTRDMLAADLPLAVILGAHTVAEQAMAVLQWLVNESGDSILGDLKLTKLDG
jgi:hypothetical protein